MERARMQNPVLLVPAALKAAYALSAAIKEGGVPQRTLLLMQLRASQINGCSLCVDMHAHELRKLGESDERLFGVTTFHDSPFFNDAERAALALTEAATRISDRSDPVPDALWDEVERHYDEAARACLILNIATINLWNRTNVITRQPADAWRNVKLPAESR